MTLTLPTRFGLPIPAIVAKSCAAIIALIAALVLIGWLLDIELLKTVAPGLISMKWNTALCFLLSALALWCSATKFHPLAVRLGRAATLITALIAGLSLLEYATGINLPLDQLFVDDRVTLIGDEPGRMATITAINFLLFGLAQLCALKRETWRNRLFLAAGFLGLADSFLQMIGYLYQISLFLDPVTSITMALHTVLCFLLLFIGQMATRPELGWFALLNAPGAGKSLFKQMLPMVIVLPVTIGWLRLQGELAGYYDMRVGLAIFTSANVLILSALLSLAAFRVVRLDRERQDSVAALQDRDARLRENEQLYSMIVHSSDDAMITKTLEGLVTSWNRGAEEIFGYSAAEMIGASILRLAVPGEESDMTQVLARIRKGEKVDHYETRRRRKDGKIIDVSVTVSPLRGYDGEIIGASKVVRDISEANFTRTELEHHRENLEELVRERTAQLSALSVQQKAILDSAAYAVIATDKNGLLTLFNPAAETMLGYRATDVVGTFFIPSLYDPNALKARAAELSAELGMKVTADLAAVVAKPRLGLEDLREWTFTRRDGTRFPGLLNVTALRDEDGEISGYLGILTGC